LNRQGLSFAILQYVGALKDVLTGDKKDKDAITSQGAALHALKIDRMLDAATYLGYWKRNELAAENEFRNQRLLVFGNIANISRDAAGDAYVSLQGAGWDNVKAVLAAETIPIAMEWKKGSKQFLVCDPGGVSLVVTLQNCLEFWDYVFLPQMQSNLEGSVSAFLRGNQPLPIRDDARVSITTAYLVGAAHPLDPACSKVGDNCLAVTQRIKKDSPLPPDDPLRTQATEMANSLKQWKS
jgi:hypothetical protein